MHNILSTPAVAGSEHQHLAASQQAFASALFDAGAQVQALAQLKGGGDKAHRLALYRGNLAANWDKSLSNAYPVLRRLVGGDFFSALARAYGMAHPSDNADLNHFGAAFAAFLERFEHVARYPYLPDMARLEWRLHRAHYAAGAHGIGAAGLAGLRPAQMENATFALHPACALLESRWSIVQSWLAHQADGEPALPAELAQPAYCLVVRPGWQAQAVPLERSAHAALGVLADGGSFGAALDAAFDIDALFDVTANLRQWVALEVLVSIASGP